MLSSQFRRGSLSIGHRGSLCVGISTYLSNACFVPEILSGKKIYLHLSHLLFGWDLLKRTKKMVQQNIHFFIKI